MQNRGVQCIYQSVHQQHQRGSWQGHGHHSIERIASDATAELLFDRAQSIPADRGISYRHQNAVHARKS